MNLGIVLSHDFGRPELAFFSIGWHSHIEGDNDPCSLRSGLTLGIMGVHIAIGIIE